MRSKTSILIIIGFIVLIISGWGCGNRQKSSTDGKNDSENTSSASICVTPSQMPRGTQDPDIHVDIYQPDKVWQGTTLLADVHDLERPRIIEVNMLGEIVWEYVIPEDLRQFTNPGFDVESLPNNNVLFVLPLHGVYEIDRAGNIVWSHLDKQITHDADRLPNGNTLYVFGGGDKANDAQVKEVNPQGEIVWSWYARDHFSGSPYKDIYDDGWTHTNSASRLPNGNTLISLRNFQFVAEVDSQGSVVRTIGEGIVHQPHDPEILSNGNMLVASHEPRPPNNALEIDPDTNEVVWRFGGDQWGRQLARDADRLPNGNTLITGSSEIIEVTPEGKIVWKLVMEVEGLDKQEAPRRGFFKSERIGRTNE